MSIDTYHTCIHFYEKDVFSLFYGYTHLQRLYMHLHWRIIFALDGVFRDCIDVIDGRRLAEFYGDVAWD